MRMRAAFLVLSVLPATLVAFAPMTADADCATLSDEGTEETDDDVLACETAVYLVCDDVVDPAGKVYNPLSTVSLGFTAPTDSVTAGGGCGGEVEVADLSGTAMSSIYDLNVSGFLAGNVDSITFEVHSIYLAGARASGTLPLAVRFDISGQSPSGSVENVASGTGAVTVTPAPIRFNVDPEASATGASESFTFTVTDMHAIFPELSVPGNGADNFHQLNLTISIDSAAYAGAWVWGATEVPASVRLNAPEDEHGVSISAIFLDAISRN